MHCQGPLKQYNHVLAASLLIAPTIFLSFPLQCMFCHLSMSNFLQPSPCRGQLLAAPPPHTRGSGAEQSCCRTFESNFLYSLTERLNAHLFSSTPNYLNISRPLPGRAGRRVQFVVHIIFFYLRILFPEDLCFDRGVNVVEVFVSFQFKDYAPTRSLLAP